MVGKKRSCFALIVNMILAVFAFSFLVGLQTPVVNAVWNSNNEGHMGWHPSEDIKVNVNGVDTSLQAFADKNFNLSAELEPWNEANHAEIGWHNGTDIKVRVISGTSTINTSLQSYIDKIVITRDGGNTGALAPWNDEEHSSWHTGEEVQIRIGELYSVQEAIDNSYMMAGGETGPRYFDGRYLAVYHPDGWASLIVPNADTDLDTVNTQNYSGITCGADNYVVVGIRYKKVSHPLNIGTDRTDGVSIICAQIDVSDVSLENKKISVTDDKVNINTNLDFNLRGPLIITDKFAGYNPMVIPTFINNDPCGALRRSLEEGTSPPSNERETLDCKCSRTSAMGGIFCTLSAEYVQAQQDQLTQAQLGAAISSIPGAIPQIVGGFLESLATYATISVAFPVLGGAYLLISNFINIGGAIGQELIDHPINDNPEISLSCGAGEVVGGINYKDYWEHGCKISEGGPVRCKLKQCDCSTTCTGCTEDDVDGFRAYCVKMNSKGVIDYSNTREESKSEDVGSSTVEEGSLAGKIAEIVTGAEVQVNNNENGPFMCPEGKVMIGIAWKDRRNLDMLDGATPLCVEYYPFR